jgi:sugar phosphate isomerase/epimerase
MRRFGVSTHLFDGERLRPEHLTAITGHGFEALELFASREHIDYHDPAAVGAFASWLRDAGLEIPSVHAPTHEPAAEMTAALEMARHIPFQHFVLQLDASRDAAVRAIDALHRVAEPLGVTLALEVTAGEPWTVGALLDLIENDLDGIRLGICMDVGHAFLSGDAAEAIETAGGYITTTHLHDNTRRRDDHLVPFQGAVDWPGVVMAFEKIGYDGVFMFEIKRQQSTAATLEQAARARKRLESLAGSWELEAGGW